ncbi:TPA: hypothetical protein U2Q81_000358 [Enterobacter hormaechei]|nr:hypothetical protein [Enterobacter hormaechei]
MNHSVSTDLIIKAKALGFTIDEVVNQTTGMYQVVFTKDGQSMPLFSMFLMSGGLFHWDQNVTLPPHIVHSLSKRYDDDSDVVRMLESLASDLEAYEA